MKNSVICQDFCRGPDHIRRRPKTFKNPIKDYRGFSSSQFQCSASVLGQVQVKLFDSCFSLIVSVFFFCYFIYFQKCVCYLFLFFHMQDVRSRCVGVGLGVENFDPQALRVGRFFFINLTTPE